jgi:hypothetical protein
LRPSYETRATRAETSSSSSKTTRRPSPLTTPLLPNISYFLLTTDAPENPASSQITAAPVSAKRTYFTSLATSRDASRVFICPPGSARDRNATDLRRRRRKLTMSHDAAAHGCVHSLNFFPQFVHHHLLKVVRSCALSYSRPRVLYLI